MQHSTHFYPQRLKRFLAQPGSKISGAAGTCWNWLHVKVPITPTFSGSPRFLGINAVRWCIYISQCEPTTVQYSHLFAMSLYSQVHWYSWTALLLSGVDAMTAGAAHDSQHNQSAIRRENRGTTPSASHKSSQVPSSVQKYATVETTSKTPPELWDCGWESFINNRRKPSNCDNCSWKNPPAKRNDQKQSIPSIMQNIALLIWIIHRLWGARPSCRLNRKQVSFWSIAWGTSGCLQRHPGRLHESCGDKAVVTWHSNSM